MPEPTTTFETLAQDIGERIAAIGEQSSPEAIRALVDERLQLLTQDDEFVRKMRFNRGDEKLLGSKFSRWGLNQSDIEYLYDIETAMRGLPDPRGGTYAGPSSELENAFKDLSDAHFVPQDEIRALDQQAIDNMFPRLPLSYYQGRDRGLAARGAWEQTDAYHRAVRAMDTAESGFGSQLIGAQYVGDLWEAARPESVVFPLIDSWEMTAPTAYLPVEVDIPELLFVAQNTASNSSEYTTVKTGSQRVQVDAKKFAIHQMWSAELDEDSLIPYVAFLRRQSALALAFYSDSLVLNGDTTNAATGNINLDDADPADTKHYLAFDAIRHAAIVDNTANAFDVAGALAYNTLLRKRNLMMDGTNLHHWGHPTKADDLVYVGDPTTVDEISLLDEVKTVDQFGPGATVLTGQQARIGMHPLISSMAVSKTEADGKVSTTGSNNVKGQIVMFNRRGFKVGWRRRTQTFVDRIPGRDQFRIEHYLRMGFGRFSPSGAASGIEAAAVLYNITLP